MRTEIVEAMKASIDWANEHKTPFGAAVLDGTKLIAVEANTGKADGPLHHAEMNVLLNLDSRIKELEKPILVTTCEPCPMCMGAAIWAGVHEIFFGASIEQASAYVGQIMIAAEKIADASFHQPIIVGGLLQHEVLTLFDRFKR